MQDFTHDATRDSAAMTPAGAAATPEGGSAPYDDARPVRYAGFWARFFASLLDSILQLIIVTPLMIWYFGIDALIQPDVDVGNFDFYTNLAVVAVVLLFWHYKSGTPGKLMMGLRIADADTLEPVPFGRLVLRLLGYLVSALPLFLGFIWVAFDRRKQGFHDKIARTVVVQNA